MNVRGTAVSSTEDCFARFDEAFAKLEADLCAANAPPDAAAPNASNAPCADLSEFEEAFDNIDRQLAAQPDSTAPSQAALTAPVAKSRESEVTAVMKSADAPTRPSLALVPPSGTALAEPLRVTAPISRELEELWEKPAGGGTPLERLVGTMQNLLWLHRVIHSRGVRSADRTRWEQVAAIFADVRQLCGEFDLQTARVRVDFALKALEEDRLDLLAIELAELVRHLRHDLQSCSIAPIAKERVWGFSLALEDRAQHAFPSAATEIAEAGRCIGFAMHDAAAFHLLRAAERGRRVLARALSPDAGDSAVHDWSAIITGLEARLHELSKWPGGAARKTAKAFFQSLLSDARAIEESRRRLADGETYQECHTMALWYDTRDFLSLAAERVSEAQDTLLTIKSFTPRT